MIECLILPLVAKKVSSSRSTYTIWTTKEHIIHTSNHGKHGLRSELPSRQRPECSCTSKLLSSMFICTWTFVTTGLTRIVVKLCWYLKNSKNETQTLKYDGTRWLYSYSNPGDCLKKWDVFPRFIILSILWLNEINMCIHILCGGSDFIWESLNYQTKRPKLTLYFL